MNLPKIEALPELLITPDRIFPARTPHTYAHVIESALAEVVELYPDIPETATIYQFPAFRNGEAWSGA